MVRDPDSRNDFYGYGESASAIFVVFSLNFSTGKFDSEIITGAGPDSELFLMFGRYFFDKNPFIGSIADINVWNR